MKKEQSIRRMSRVQSRLYDSTAPRVWPGDPDQIPKVMEWATVQLDESVKRRVLDLGIKNGDKFFVGDQVCRVAARRTGIDRAVVEGYSMALPDFQHAVFRLPVATGDRNSMTKFPSRDQIAGVTAGMAGEAVSRVMAKPGEAGEICPAAIVADLTTPWTNSEREQAAAARRTDAAVIIAEVEQLLASAELDKAKLPDEQFEATHLAAVSVDDLPPVSSYTFFGRIKAAVANFFKGSV